MPVLRGHNVTTQSEVELSIDTAASLSLAEDFVGERLGSAPLSEHRATLAHGHFSFDSRRATFLPDILV